MSVYTVCSPHSIKLAAAPAQAPALYQQAMPSRQAFFIRVSQNVLSGLFIMPSLAWTGCQVGASNELPESEELDALYDRFLIRRSVSQVSSSQLANLARLAAGSRIVAEPASNGAGGNGAATPPADPQQGPGLDLEDFRYDTDCTKGRLHICQWYHTQSSLSTLAFCEPVRCLLLVPH